uniref:hypothetical protein n=1 Tax=Salinispora oceanensis TaxID=1050199 RepID=UPI001CC47F1E|nr:hypothetical protein [Salinispora oceanensis]
MAELVRVRRLSDQEGQQLLRIIRRGTGSQAYLRWRNANARHPDILAAQRRERARIRSERQRRWGQPATRAA